MAYQLAHEARQHLQLRFSGLRVDENQQPVSLFAKFDEKSYLAGTVSKDHEKGKGDAFKSSMMSRDQLMDVDVIVDVPSVEDVVSMRVKYGRKLEFLYPAAA